MTAVYRGGEKFRFISFTFSSRLKAHAVEYNGKTH